MQEGELAERRWAQRQLCMVIAPSGCHAAFHFKRSHERPTRLALIIMHSDPHSSSNDLVLRFGDLFTAPPICISKCFKPSCRTMPLEERSTVSSW